MPKVEEKKLAEENVAEIHESRTAPEAQNEPKVEIPTKPTVAEGEGWVAENVVEPIKEIKSKVAEEIPVEEIKPEVAEEAPAEEIPMEKMEVENAPPNPPN